MSYDKIVNPDLNLSVSFACKPFSMTEVYGAAQRTCKDTMQKVSIAEVIRLTAADYDQFIQNFFQPYAWLTGKGGLAGCLRVEAPGRHALVVNPEGYDYARYVALA